MDSLTSKAVSDRLPQAQHPLLASGVLKKLPCPASTVSSEGEVESENEAPPQGAISSTVKFDSSGGAGGDNDDNAESLTLPAVITTGATSSSGGSGDEGGASGGGGGGRRVIKRKLLDELEEFAPKRRSSRVSE